MGVVLTYKFKEDENYIYVGKLTAMKILNLNKEKELRALINEGFLTLCKMKNRKEAIRIKKPNYYKRYKTQQLPSVWDRFGLTKPKD